LKKLSFSKYFSGNPPKNTHVITGTRKNNMSTTDLNSEYNTLCLHHNDTDGRASAAIVRRALGPKVWLYETNYGNSLPMERVLTSDHIIIVDFSLPRAEMENLAAYHQITWIDHHKSAIEELADSAEDWPGIRNIGEAACVLTWQYFFPNEPVPRSVKLIGDRDIWRWAEPETGPFNEGIYQLDTRPINDRLWSALLDDDPQLMEEVITSGRTIREARMREIRRALSQRGYAVNFEGHYTLVINLRGSGDIGQQIRDMGYDLAYCYVDTLHKGEITTFVTLYSAEVDVSKIAERFGGGGHAGAAGFHYKRGATPFPPGVEIDLNVHD
jgi:uncharacterized protein